MVNTTGDTMEFNARFNAGSLTKDYSLPWDIPENAFLARVHGNEICTRTGCDPTIFTPVPGK